MKTENDKLREQNEILAEKLSKLEQDLRAPVQESQPKLQEEGNLLKQQQAGSAGKLKHVLASPMPRRVGPCLQDMQDKLNALFDSQQAKQKHQLPVPAGELGLELGLSLALLRDLAKDVGSLEGTKGR
eukprot:764006-Hanusia_phi.AAC.2